MRTFSGAEIVGGRLRAAVVFFASSSPEWNVASGESTEALEIRACLKPGTAAGTYPLTLELAELSLAYLADGTPYRGPAIEPDLQSGTLTVAADVESAAECDTYVPQPGDVNVQFKLQDASGTPGSTVDVPFAINADRASTGFNYYINFDEEVLEALETRKLWFRPSGVPYEFELFLMDSRNETPGNGVDEGLLLGAATLSLVDSTDVLPPGQEVPVLEFELRIRESVAAGYKTELEFREDSGNRIYAGGEEITPILASSFVFVNGRINIIPDGTPFVRGDSNVDEHVDISDAQYTLNFLFLGAGRPRCLDAADANDDGRVDISDPVATLGYLFLGSGSLPPPRGSPGQDPTPDSLDCR
jgi:hypothetical protein